MTRSDNRRNPSEALAEANLTEGQRAANRNARGFWGQQERRSGTGSATADHSKAANDGQ